jgi:hypothetical protein
MSIEVVRTRISLHEIRRMAHEQFGDFVKAVVDVEQELIAINGELHADEEALLLQHGARQTDLWGINLYPDRPPVELIEFDSMINVRLPRATDPAGLTTQRCNVGYKPSWQDWSFRDRAGVPAPRAGGGQMGNALAGGAAR